MTTLLYFVVTLVVVGVLYALLRRPVSEYVKMRGARVIACPDNQQPAAVTVDARHAAFTAAGGHEHLRLDSCSRWPEKAGCGQECLKQIETQPMDCLVRTQVSRWYTDKACAHLRQGAGGGRLGLAQARAARAGRRARWNGATSSPRRCSR